MVGQIVGIWSGDPDCPGCFTGAFRLTPHGFQNLEAAGASETVAYGINDLGQIVGSYFGEDEVLHGYVRDRDRSLDDDGMTEAHPIDFLMDGSSKSGLCEDGAAERTRRTSLARRTS
jgi:uncharacterized membrane protein